MESPSRDGSTFGRRGVLRLVALAPIAALLGTSCTSRPDEPDPLEALASSARSDAALAQAIARARADLSGPATAVANARTEHRRALRREIDRVNPPDPGTPQPPAPQPSAPSSSEEATAALSAALRTARGEASGMVPTLPTYRAGLAGSVSASCASLLEVLE